MRALRVDRLAEEQGSAGALGKVRGSALNEALLGSVEYRLVGFPVEAERTSCLAGLRTQGRHHSWSAPNALLACQRGLPLGSPWVASWRVEMPLSARATSTIWLTSSP